MDSLESKKLALLRILQILYAYSDSEHRLIYDEILTLLRRDYGLTVERKAVGRNLSLLREAGFEIVTTPRGSYLAERPFEDAELRLLIDGVLSSAHISGSSASSPTAISSDRSKISAPSANGTRRKTKPCSFISR